MSLTIVTGPAQAGKTQACIQTLARDDPPEIILMCETTYLSDSLGRRLTLRRQTEATRSETGDAGDSSCVVTPDAGVVPDILLNKSHITTMTFRDLTEKLWGLHGDERAFIGQAARETLVDELLAERGQTGPLDSLRTAGGRRFLAEVIQACASSGTRSYQGQLPVALRTLIDAYDEQLQARGLIEPDAALLDLTQRGVFTNAAYGYLGFTDFPPAQRAYVRMLTALTGVAIAVTCESTGEATREGRRFAATLAVDYQAQTGEDPAQLEIAVCPESRKETELCALRAEFLNDTDAVHEAFLDRGSSVLQLITAQGEDEEIRAAVEAVGAALNTIAQQCKIVDLSTDDAPVALIFRHLGSKVGRIAQALGSASLSVAFDLKVPFRQAGLGASLCALLRLPSADDDVAQVASGYLLSAYSGKTQAQAAEIERVLREKDPGYSQRLCDMLGVPELSRLTAEEWACLATELLFRAARVGRNDYLRQLDFAAHKLFLAQLAEQRELELGAAPAKSAATMKSPPLDPRKILAGLQSAHINLTPPPGSTQVLVSEASRMRGRQFHTVVLAGLAQQDFSAAIEPSLAEYTVSQITGRAEPDKLVGEHQLWYDLLGCAREALVLIGQDRDLSGRELAPSALLEELRSRFCSDKPKQEGQEGQGSAAGTKVVAASSSAAPSLPARGQAAGFDFGPHGQPPFAVTTLERYARCPYAFFLDAFVARRRIRGNIDALNEGLILHATLERFYRRAAQELGEAHVRSATLERAYRLLDRCFDEAWQEKLDVSSTAQLPQATQVSLEALREALHGFLADEVTWLPGFTPRYFEHSFGKEEGVAAPMVGGVAIKGVIDRIDTYEPPEAEDEDEGPDKGKAEAETEGLFFIVDYKRRGLANGGQLRARISHKEIQATVYGLAAVQLLAPLRYAGSSYRNIYNPRNLKVEHPVSLRNQYWEQMGFPESGRLTPQAIGDRPKKGQPSMYERGIAGIEDIVRVAARGLSSGDATIALPRNSKGEEMERCNFARDCLYRACPYFHKDVWL